MLPLGKCSRGKALHGGDGDRSATPRQSRGLRLQLSSSPFHPFLIPFSRLGIIHGRVDALGEIAKNIADGDDPRELAPCHNRHVPIAADVHFM